MSALTRAAHWYLGIESPASGERTDLALQWQPFIPREAVFAFLAVLAIVAVYVYRRDAAGASRSVRWSLLSLRLLLLLLVAVFLSGAELSVDRMALPSVAVLIDDSASMGLKDRYRDSSNGEPTADQSRLDLAEDLLTRREAAFLRSLAQRHAVRVYRFADELHPVAVAGSPREIGPLSAAISAIEAGGDRTRPGPALRAAIEDAAGALPAAVIVLTDGIASTGVADRLSTGAELARRRLVPVFAVGIGSDEPARDLDLYDVAVDEFAFVGDPIRVAARLKSFGYEGREATVRLLRAGSREPLASATLKLGPDETPQPFELLHTPTEVGTVEYIVEVEALPDEANAVNNRQTRLVNVRQEKLRVLVADSVPRYEFRFLKHFLERQPSIELRTVLQDAAVEYAAEDQTALQNFPMRREELFGYDVLVLGDVDLRLLSPTILENIREFVREGGGLLLIAGSRHNPVSYAGTPLADLLPFDPAGVVLPDFESPRADGFHPQLTAIGRRGTPLFRFAESEEASDRIWSELPELFWAALLPALKPGASTLVTQPAPPAGVELRPLIAMQSFGSGRVLFHATDELWRWRYREGTEYYGRYWGQAVRYLGRSRFRGGDRAAELTTNRSVYELGDSVQLSVRFANEAAIPAGSAVRVKIEQRGGAEQVLTLSQDPELATLFEATAGSLPEGSYRATLAEPVLTGTPPFDDFRVETPARELQVRALDRADLERTAEITGGRYYSIGDASALPRDIPAGQPSLLQSQEPIPLWNRWELMLLFAAVLTGEWLLRRRAGLA